jgi:hypothetical protein
MGNPSDSAFASICIRTGEKPLNQENFDNGLRVKPYEIGALQLFQSEPSSKSK